jgi:hypothetical protein
MKFINLVTAPISVLFTTQRDPDSARLHGVQVLPGESKEIAVEGATSYLYIKNDSNIVLWEGYVPIVSEISFDGNVKVNGMVIPKMRNGRTISIKVLLMIVVLILILTYLCNRYGDRLGLSI